ncbi:endonuclease III [uncultured Tessaracoccus sp.]|uniref:endonuclease III n=1 Tax=uncultured Tessaracoccus sp. TaxID=905023 RepID=UPI00262F3EF7|nr:endonuclease III [uncultured Tessaracoccus sp.]
MESAARVADKLAEAYPDARCELDFTTPFELLVATVLSAQSTDVRVNAVTPKLFDEFPDAEALAIASPERVESIIRPVGMYRNKAVALVGLSQMIVDEYAGAVPDTLEQLVALPGVGRKTANVVLGNAFGVPGITPDTHVMRVSNRLGWVDERKPDVVERRLMELLPRERWTVMSHVLIAHGRRICHARRPACGACPVADACPSNDCGEQDPKKAAALVAQGTSQ